MTTSDAKQHATILDPKGEVARAMEIASDLCLVEDPPEEPFRSKYKARDVLTKAKQSHAREAASGSAAVSGPCGLWVVREVLGVVSVLSPGNEGVRWISAKVCLTYASII